VEVGKYTIKPQPNLHGYNTYLGYDKDVTEYDGGVKIKPLDWLNERQEAPLIDKGSPWQA